MARSGMRRGAEGCRGVQRGAEGSLPSRAAGRIPDTESAPGTYPGTIATPPHPGCRRASHAATLPENSGRVAASLQGRLPAGRRIRTQPPPFQLAATSAHPVSPNFLISIHPSERSKRPNVHAPSAPRPTISQLAGHPIPRRHARLSPLLKPIANKKILLPTVGEEDFSKDIGRGSRRESVDVRISEPAAGSRRRTSDLPRGCRTRADPYRPESGDRKSRSLSGSPAGRPSPGWLPR